MHEEKHAAIKQYLAEKFPGCEIEQQHDFARRAQSFKLHIVAVTLLLKVGDEFIDDNSTPEILRLFNLWGVAEVPPLATSKSPTYGHPNSPRQDRRNCNAVGGGGSVF